MEEESYKIKAVGQSQKEDGVMTRYICKIADILEACRLEVNKSSSFQSEMRIHFVKQGTQGLYNTLRAWSLLNPGAEWSLMADLNQLFRFSQEITSTSLRPDIIIWSSITKTVIMVELIILWEEGMKAAFERKKDMYSEFAATCSQASLSQWRLGEEAL